MKNNGLFCSLFIEDLKKDIALSDAALSRMAILAHAWRNCDAEDEKMLWEPYVKRALSYLEFVPANQPEAPGVYPLYEDYGFAECVCVLYLVPLRRNIDDISLGCFFPARLLLHLEKRNINWGILTNGLRWRLYSTKSSRPYEDYVELDLAETLEGSDEAEYGLFEQFFHRDSFIVDREDGASQDSSLRPTVPGKCRLDHDRKRSEETLDQHVKEPFLKQIDEVLQNICNGFIFETRTGKKSSSSGLEYTEEGRKEIFESAVKLIYRCLFLFYAEARRLFPAKPEQAKLYQRLSMHTLCQEARKFRWGQRRDYEEYDLWKHLKGLIDAVNNGDPEYGIMGYDGGLFDDEEEVFLGRHQLRNNFLARALYLLAFIDPLDNDPSSEYPIPYEDLEVRHLGELYENILEYTVSLAEADYIRRRNKKGVVTLLASETTRKTGDTLIEKGDVYFGESALERKQTGSYYTPESLVCFLNHKSIVRPLKENFEQEYRQRFDSLLEQAHSGLSVEIRRGAATSAAALVEHFVGEDLLNFKVCDPAMGSGHFLVDATNQMAGLVVSLLAEIPYLEGAAAGHSRPNHWRRLITRYCIYGVDLNPLAVNLAKLSLWLNCFAVEHRLTFLDHHLRCGNSLIGIRSIDQLETVPMRKGEKRSKDDKQLVLFDIGNLSAVLAQVTKGIVSISHIDEDNTDAQKALLLESEASVAVIKPLADLYTACLMDQKIDAGDYEKIFESLAEGTVKIVPEGLQKIFESVEGYSIRHSFFHWPLEFPEIFGPGGTGGFSATVGNPPWDIVKPNSQEFFSEYDPDFRTYKKQEANRTSKAMMTDNPEIEVKWRQYRDGFARQSTYFREPLSYSALGGGDINTFKLFLEQFFTILDQGGHMGIVVPSGVYTDKGCQALREMFFEQSQIEYLYCFENRWPTVFNGVDGRFKFVVFGTQKGGRTDNFKCAFMEHDPERLPVIDANALEMSVKQVKKFSPDTLSIMEFNSQRDIDITEKVYGNWPLMGEKLEGIWNVKFGSELHMTNDSNLFKTAPTDCPLYEGKMVWLFDSNFENPRYWLAEGDVKKRLGENAWEGQHYRIGFRNIAASTNERSLVCGVIPPSFHGNSFPTITPQSSSWQGPNIPETMWITSILSSFCIDFLIRQKVSMNLNFFFIESLPVPRRATDNISFAVMIARVGRLLCCTKEFATLWETIFAPEWQSPNFWYPSHTVIDAYGPAHEQEIRKRLREEAQTLTPEWGPHCGVHDRLPDRRDTGDRAQLRAEIDAYVAHLYGLSRDDFAYILDTFPVLKKKEEKAFGEFMSRRKCLEEYDRIKIVLEEMK